MKKHIAFFSQTGSEIVNIAKHRNRWPDLVVTNKQDIEDVNQELLDNCINKLVIIPNKPSIEEYETAIEQINEPTNNVVITLHGYLRIFPKEICDKYNIYNGHPGAIHLYSELKGKDPQERALKYPKIGAVIHKVTADLDEGPIIGVVDKTNKYNSTAEITKALKELSLALWLTKLPLILQ